jgi:pyridoxine/pyridoxamine 5'-phosphate oxidase
MRERIILSFVIALEILIQSRETSISNSLADSIFSGGAKSHRRHALLLRLRGSGRNRKATSGKAGRLIATNISAEQSIRIQNAKLSNSRRRTNITDRRTIVKRNVCFEKYYQAQEIVDPNDWTSFMEALGKPLPLTFRIAGQPAFADAFLSDFENDYLSINGLNPQPPDQSNASICEAVGQSGDLPLRSLLERSGCSVETAAAVFDSNSTPTKDQASMASPATARRLWWYPGGRAIQVDLFLRACMCT